MVMQVGMFEETLRSCEDWDLWIRLVFAGVSVVSVPKIGAYYRDTPGSMSKNRLRMLQTRTEVLFRAHDLVCQKSELLKVFGDGLLEAYQRVRRRWYVHGGGEDYVNRLTLMIRGLCSRGFTRHQSFAKRTVDLLIGESTAERLALTCFRWLDPVLYRYYYNGYA
jgi:hypothetical protein